eukprot:1156235-Pelagomonas_calceolata.AAC.3
MSKLPCQTGPTVMYAQGLGLDEKLSRSKGGKQPLPSAPLLRADSGWVSTIPAGTKKEAVLHPIWQKKPVRLTQNDERSWTQAAGGTGGLSWWGDPSGWVCKPMQEVTSHRNHRVPWRLELIPGCCPA